MKSRDKKFLLIGIIIAVAIAIAAPFVASSNPDGLESTAEEFESAEDKEQDDYESPMPDYTVKSLGENGLSGAAAVVLGTVITLLIVICIFYGLVRFKRSRKPEDSKINSEDTITKRD